jgi:glucokinase
MGLGEFVRVPKDGAPYFRATSKAIGRMFSIAANFTDHDAYFVGGGIVEAEPHFRDWCMDIVRASTELRDEQRQIFSSR